MRSPVLLLALAALLAGCIKNPTVTPVTPDPGYQLAAEFCAKIEAKKK